MSNWSRAMLVPLAIINHFKPTRPVKVDLDELYPEGVHERDLAPAPDPERIICSRTRLENECRSCGCSEKYDG